LTAPAPPASPPTAPSQAAQPFSGWRVAALAALVLGMSAPGQTVGVSVFIDPMVATLELSRSQVSGAYLVGTLLGAAALPQLGAAVDRLGVRRALTLVAAAFGLALAAMAGVSSLGWLTLGFVGIRMLGQGSLTLVSTTAVSLWFDRRRGLAIGASGAAGAALMSLAPLALAAAVAAAGWRQAWLLAAAAVWLVVLPAARWGIPDSPSAVGQHTDGDAVASVGDRPTAGWTREEAVRTRMFWALTAAVAASGMLVTALAFHQVSLLGSLGSSPAQAAANFLPQTAAALLATAAAGALADRLPPRLLVLAAMALLAGALVLASTATPGLPALGFGLAVGAAGGTARAVEGTLFPRCFGVAHLGAIRGVVMAVGVAASAFGPLILAVGFDRTGSYAAALTALLTVPAAVAVLALTAPMPNPTHRPRTAPPASH